MRLVFIRTESEDNMQFKIAFDFPREEQKNTIASINNVLSKIPLSNIRIESSKGALIRTYKETGELETQNYEFQKITLLCSRSDEEGDMYYCGIDTVIFTEEETPDASEFIALWRNNNSERKNMDFLSVNIPRTHNNVYIVPYYEKENKSE